MRYVIAGGGAYGTHYVKKLLQGIDSGRIKLDEIVVVDRDRACQVAGLAEAEPRVRLEVSDWRSFAERVWTDPDSWAEDIWIPGSDSSPHPR